MVIILVTLVVLAVIYQTGMTSPLVDFFMSRCMEDNLELTLIFIVLFSLAYIKMVSSSD